MDLFDQLRDHVDLFDQMNEQLLDFLQVVVFLVLCSENFVRRCLFSGKSIGPNNRNPFSIHLVHFKSLSFLAILNMLNDISVCSSLSSLFQVTIFIRLCFSHLRSLDTSLDYQNFAHETLQQLVLIVPLYVHLISISIHFILKIVCFTRACTLLYPTAEQHFPFMNKDVNIQVIYIQHLLRTLSYLPVQRTRFFEIILSRLIRMDVSVISPLLFRFSPCSLGSCISSGYSPCRKEQSRK